jgi:hypothetical protein
MKTPKDLLAEYIHKVASSGGKARAKKLSKARRKEIGRKAARARWGKKGKK